MEFHDRRRIHAREELKEATMDKINKLFSDPHVGNMQPAPDYNNSGSHLTIRIADKRVSRLLLVLQQLDESVAGLEDLQESELSELVSVAIRGCGFTDPVEASYAIATVLEAIEKYDSPPECL
jgi:hypothetical protein